MRVSIEAVKTAKTPRARSATPPAQVHTIEAFVAQKQAIADMGIDSIAIRDMAGLLTPHATGDLVKA